VQLVHRPRYDDWSWPKGKLDEGEPEQAAAAREVAEETGKPILLGRPLPGTRYRLSSGQRKTVAYWAARRAKITRDPWPLSARLPVIPASSEEIDRVKWVSATKARSLLTRKSDRAPLDQLVAEHEAGRLETHVLIIARHGKAYARASWPGEEAARPLTPLGHGQAHALVPVLAAYGVAKIVSSQWERCASTVAPYAAVTGLQPWTADHLSEAKHAQDPDSVAETMVRLLTADASSVLCTHRPVLPTVMKVLREHTDDYAVSAALPSSNPYLDPGELLVTHIATTVDGPRVVAVEYVTPPMS
jgi:8-oxo-dGTP diphosphatase